MHKYILIYVSFADKLQAKIITKALLEKKLIACAKFSEIQSQYWWDGSIENSDEVLATLETREDKFDEIKKIIKSMHTYEQLSMFAVPMTNLATGVSDWIDNSLN